MLFCCGWLRHRALTRSLTEIFTVWARACPSPGTGTLSCLFAWIVFMNDSEIVVVLSEQQSMYVVYAMNGISIGCVYMNECYLAHIRSRIGSLRRQRWGRVYATYFKIPMFSRYEPQFILTRSLYVDESMLLVRQNSVVLEISGKRIAYSILYSLLDKTDVWHCNNQASEHVVGRRHTKTHTYTCMHGYFWASVAHKHTHTHTPTHIRAVHC